MFSDCMSIFQAFSIFSPCSRGIGEEDCFNYLFHPHRIQFTLLVYSSSLVYVSTAIFFAEFRLEQLNCLSSLSLAEDGSPIAVLCPVVDTVVEVELAGG